MLRNYCVFFMLVAVAPAQTPATLEGSVVNSLTREPLRKADLTLSTEPGFDGLNLSAAMQAFGGDAASIPDFTSSTGKTYQAVSDAGGKFKFTAIPPGDYYLTAKHAGFVNTSPADVLHLGAGEGSTGIVLRMVPQGAISGRILDEDGDPVTGAVVTALVPNYAMGRLQLMPGDAATSDGRGQYRLEKLPPGRYYLSVNPQRMNGPAVAAETAYVSTWYPGTTDIATAAKVDVAAGSDVPNFNVQLRKVAVTRIKGHALNADGSPMKSVPVMLTSSAVGMFGGMRMAMADDKGAFELVNIEPGVYTITTTQMEGFLPKMQMHPLVVPKEGLKDVRVATLPDGTVQGKVVVAGDGKIRTKGVSVILMSAGAPTGPVLGLVDDANAFSLKLSPSTYYFTLQPVPHGSYVKSVRLNDREFVGKELDFSAGALGQLVVTLGTDGARLDATLTLSDGKPVVGGTVLLLPAKPADRSEATAKTVDTSPTGHAFFMDVPPGDYLLFAWREVERGAWFDQEFMQTEETKGTRISLDAKGSATVSLRQIQKIP